MTDEVQQIPVGLKKVAALIGDGENTIFDVEHPAAPNVVVNVYRTIGGETIMGYSLFHDNGRVSLGFAQPPVKDAFIAVVVG